MHQRSSHQRIGPQVSLAARASPRCASRLKRPRLITVAVAPPPLYRLVQNEVMPPSSLTREEVIDRLMDVFRRLAYDGASLAEFSKATGLGKSSLYHYFPGGKEDMGRAVLGRATKWLEEVAKVSLDGK